MHSPGTFTSRSHTRGGPNGSSPHMKLAMRPCVTHNNALSAMSEGKERDGARDGSWYAARGLLSHSERSFTLTCR